MRRNGGVETKRQGYYTPLGALGLGKAVTLTMLDPSALISTGRVHRRKSRPNRDETIQSAEMERNGHVMWGKSKPTHEEAEAILLWVR